MLEFFFMAEVKGKMAKEDPRNRLVEDCARFVSERGCTCSGMATTLLQQLVSNFKPDRPNALCKFLKDSSEHEANISYASETERFKDEHGECNSRRIFTLCVEKPRKVVTS